MKKWIQKNKDFIFATAVGGVLAFLAVEILKSIFGFLNRSRGGLFKFLVGLSNISVNVPLLYLLLFVVLAFAFYRISKRVKIRKRRFRVIKGTYGSADKSYDITQELNNAVVDNKLKLVLSNNIAGDPHVGVVKTGRIKYEFDGRKYEKEYTEGDVIDLPHTANSENRTIEPPTS